MLPTADEMFIHVLKNAACAAAHRADLAAADDDPETVHACIEAAYAALDEMYGVRRSAGEQFPMNDNMPALEAIEA